MAKEKQYKLKFRPTPIGRLAKRPKTPFRMVGFPYADNWQQYYKLNYEFMIAEKRRTQPEKRQPKPLTITRDQFSSALLANNYQNIGHGAFANVFAKPNSDIAVKVGEVPDTWPSYVKWATKEGFAGTFAPKVYSLKFYRPEDAAPYYVATMERLVDTMNGIQENNHHRPTKINQLYSELVDVISRGKPSQHAELIQNHPDLEAFGKALNAQEYRWDLHGSNAMVRKDGQLVITDPQSEDKESNFRIRRGFVHYV